MNNGYTHRQCGDCWIFFNLKMSPSGDMEFRVPVLVKGLEPGKCCFCGNNTRLGVFVRENPENLKCTHEKDEC